MVPEAAPVLIAYDGSDLAKAAVREAAGLFAGRATVVATVWEPALAAAFPATAGPLGESAIGLDPATIETLDRVHREHAVNVAAEGAELASSLRLAAEPHVVADQLDVADTLIDIARERGAAVVVVGSHGISGLRARLLGGVSRKLLAHCDRPVLVVRGERQELSG
jgi:nucleotide-binding universal stress UspA family protein